MILMSGRAFDSSGFDVDFNTAYADAPEFAKTLYSKLGYAFFTSQAYDLNNGIITHSQLPSVLGRRIEFWFTSHCNLSCDYCLFKAALPIFDMSEKKTFFNREKTKEFLNITRPSLISLLGGEVTLFPDEIQEYVEILKELGAPKSTLLSINTNGTNPKILERFKEENIEWYVSLASDELSSNSKHISYKHMGENSDLNIKYRLMLGNDIDPRCLDYDFAEYRMIRPMNDVDETYWTDRLDTILKMIELPRVTEFFYGKYSYMDIYGGAAGCTQHQYFEELTDDNSVMLNACFYTSKLNVFNKHADLDEDFIFDGINQFSVEHASKLRDRTFNRLRHRIAYFQHCSIAKNAYGKNNTVNDIVEGTLAIKGYLDNGVFAEVIEQKRKYALLYNAFNAVEIKMDPVDVIIEPMYSGNGFRDLELCDYNSLIGLFGETLDHIWLDRIKTDREQYGWGDSGSCDIVITKYGSEFFAELDDSAMVSCFVEFGPLNFYLIGRKKDVVAVYNLEKTSWSKYNSAAFYVMKQYDKANRSQNNA